MAESRRRARPKSQEGFFRRLFPRYENTSVDLTFLVMVILLLVFGLIMVFSASYPSANAKYGNGLYFIQKQAMWAVLGVGAMIFTMKFDYRLYKKFALPIAMVTIALLILVLFSTPIKGSRRWLGFGSFTIQPSEAAKIAVIIYFAASLSAPFVKTFLVPSN